MLLSLTGKSLNILLAFFRSSILGHLASKIGECKNNVFLLITIWTLELSLLANSFKKSFRSKAAVACPGVPRMRIFQIR